MRSINYFWFFILVLVSHTFIPLLMSPYTYKYTIVIFGLVVILFALLKKDPAQKSSSLKSLLNIIYLFIGVIIVKMIIYTDISDQMIKLVLPFFLGAIVVFYYLSVPEDLHFALSQKIFSALYILFFVQLGLSIIESLSGSFFVADYNIANKVYLSDSTLYSKRFIIPLPSILNPFSYLSFGLSGLLGQHNLWALQLPVYNLIFLYAYVRDRKKKYIAALIFIVIAQVLNTTRTSLVLIVICDVLTLLHLYNLRSKISRKKIYFVLAFVALLLNQEIIELLQAIVTKSDTLTIRLSIYQYAWYYFTYHYQELLFGYNYQMLGDLVSGFLVSANYNVILNSFENGFFDMVFIYGIVGMILFVTLVWNSVTLMRKNNHGLFFGMLFLLYIIFINMTLSHIFHPFVFPYMMLFIIIIAVDGRQKEIRSLKTTAAS